jgi:hypothetical protein
MKSSLSLLFLLLFAASTQAQHSHSFSSGSIINQGGGYGGGYSGGWDGYGAGGYGSGGSHHHGGLRYEPPREFAAGYATNDAPYVPSTFMNYEDALALGKQQLAAMQSSSVSIAGPPLGDVARALRGKKPPSENTKVMVLQDHDGKLLVCGAAVSLCREF